MSDKSGQAVEDIYAPDPYGAAQASASGPGLTQRVEKEPTIGRPLPRWDKRKFRYDRFEALSGTQVSWHVSKDDRMEASEAGLVLHRVHGLFGIQTENPVILEAFNKSLFFCHTLNSGSILQPGRSKLYIKGQAFDFSQVVRFLGDDIRRFFRAYADEVREVNKEVLHSYNPYEPDSVERHSWLVEVATERGLLRYPDLAHDSADKCSNLIPAERAALAGSKQGVFANIVNTADRIHSNARVVGPDGFDSELASVSKGTGAAK